MDCCTDEEGEAWGKLSFERPENELQSYSRRKNHLSSSTDLFKATCLAMKQQEDKAQENRQPITKAQKACHEAGKLPNLNTNKGMHTAYRQATNRTSCTLYTAGVLVPRFHLKLISIHCHLSMIKWCESCI